MTKFREGKQQLSPGMKHKFAYTRGYYFYLHRVRRALFMDQGSPDKHRKDSNVSQLWLMGIVHGDCWIFDSLHRPPTIQTPWIVVHTHIYQNIDICGIKVTIFALIRKIIDEFAISHWMYVIYLNSTYTYIRHYSYGTQQKIPTIYTHFEWNSLAVTFRCYDHDDVTLTTLAISEMQIKFCLLTWRIERKPRVRRFMIFDTIH